MKKLDIQELQLFPTFLYSIENFLEKKERNKILKYTSMKYKPLNYIFQPKNMEQNKEVYKSLSDKIKLISKNIFSRHKIIYDTFEITSMWTNIINENHNINPHSHANSFLSGVYYLKTDENSSNIVFSDPRIQSMMIRPKVSEWTLHNCISWSVKPKENSIIFFPSWLQHSIELNKSKERISIAFNIMFNNLPSEGLL